MISTVAPVAAVSTSFFQQHARHLRRSSSSSTTTTATVDEQRAISTVERDFVQDVSNGTCTESCCQQFQLLDTATCPVCEVCGNTNPFSFLPAAVQFILVAVLVGASAMFSGLTLGIMGLDKTGLEIVMDSDDAVNAAYARRIYPLRKNGNLLLCTLLLGNTSANALVSILIADKAGGLIGFISSTFIILILGEIIPQAICSRYALQLGSRAVPLVRVIMIIMYPIAKPLAYALDKALGKELATTYSGAEMLKLLQIHVEENAMDAETAHTMGGALRYKDVAVRDVMTPLANVFMLKADEKLNFETIAKIFKTGYSRIPVYEVSKVRNNTTPRERRFYSMQPLVLQSPWFRRSLTHNTLRSSVCITMQMNVIGLLFVKDLIFVDPEDATRVADFIDIFGRGVHVVWPDDKLGDVLRELKQGRSHMALVRDVNQNDETQDPFYEVAGIITLEDIIEEILGTLV
jgi:metal transporter CNNM